MKSEEPVWFGCDVKKFSTREEGALDMNAYDYGSLFGIKLCMDKADWLKNGSPVMAHAMVLMPWYSREWIWTKTGNHFAGV